MVYAIKKQKETTAALLRRFSKNVQQSGLLLEARKGRFYSKKANHRARKASALRKLERKKERERLQKLGKLPQKEIRPHFR
ncbi:MAG: 30S ribosomal protein S21 [Candidatus Sungbacteria bacterium]|nr:30S ribosomal protein S21 [Candidatus Sungbacteria bacterium]